MTHSPVLILGARSDMAMSIARQFASEGYPIQLAARQPETLKADAKDIELRHNIQVTLHDFDALQIERHQGFVDSLPELPQIAVCAIGYMGTQEENQIDSEAASLVLRSNFEGPANILGILANAFEARGNGTLVGISSVAGLRGRASNYVYGSAKAGFTAFLSGLRNRLASKGVHVVTVLPGFVNTKMTAGMETPAPLTAEPEEVAKAVSKAVSSGRNVIYVRPIWRLVMLVITSIPEAIFKKTNL